jgi:hypothetical protein
MLTEYHVPNLVELERKLNAAVENSHAAREAANLADFRYHATLKVGEHAINLKQALERNRFLEDAELYAPVYLILMKAQQEAQGAYTNAQAVFELARKTVDVCFCELRDARKWAGFCVPENEPGVTDEVSVNT